MLSLADYIEKYTRRNIYKTSTRVFCFKCKEFSIIRHNGEIFDLANSQIYHQYYWGCDTKKCSGVTFFIRPNKSLIASYISQYLPLMDLVKDKCSSITFG